MGGVNDLRTPEGGVVEFDFAELAGFDGLTTEAGYVFESGLTADTPIYRILFDAQAVPAPEPAALALLALGAGGMAVARHKRS